MKLLFILLIFIVGCKNESEKWNYKITQRWEYHRPDYWYTIWEKEKDGWKLSTYVYKNDVIIKSWGVNTEQPDTCKQKYLDLAKEYIEEDKRRYDTIIYIK